MIDQLCPDERPAVNHSMSLLSRLRAWPENDSASALWLVKQRDYRRMTMVTSRIEQIATAGAPAPAGHYSQGTIAGGSLYISGQLPIRPDGAPLPDDSFDSQARQAVTNMLAILKAGGGEKTDLARVTAYIVGVVNWPRFNAIYAELLGDARPARTVVPVGELHHGFLVEVDAVAWLPTGS